MKRDLLLFLILCVASLGIARSETIFVDKDHGQALDDAGCGSEGTSGEPGDYPCETIRWAAFFRAGQSDTITIKEGVYEEQEEVLTRNGTSWDNPTTVMAFPGHTVVVKPADNPPAGIGPEDPDRVFFFPSRRYVILDGLVLDGTNVEYNGVHINASSHHIRIQNTEIRNVGRASCIFTAADDSQFVNLHLHDCGGSAFGAHGVYNVAKRVLIHGCTVHDNSHGGIHVFSGNGTCIGGTNAGNLCVSDADCSGGGTCDDCHLTQSCDDQTDGTIVRNNVSYNHPNGSGIYLWNGTGLQAYYNTVFDNVIGLQVEHAVDTYVFRNRVFNNSAEGIIVKTDSTGAAVMGNVVFSNAAGKDLVDTGTATSLAGNDF